MADTSREALHRRVATAFVHSWNTGLDADPPTFLAQFAPTIDWADHAFHIRHQGLASMALFRTKWLTAIQNFSASIEAIDIIASGAVVRVIYHGTMVGKLPRRLPSGKTFHAHVLILLGIDGQGKIEKVDEYYSALLDESRGVENYQLMGAAKKDSGKL